MIDPIASQRPSPLGPPLRPDAAARPQRSGETAPGAADGAFANTLRQQLEQVSRIQEEADAGVQRLMTGESQNITEVFTAARKAELAFGLMMEIRNKLVEAYAELRQVRV
jgi:flagellar hook-basal body complex protein FliE